MSQPQNRYKADLRELNFVLFEQFNLRDVLGKEPYAEWGPDEVKMTLDGVYRFATEVLGPLNAVGDSEGCRLENGQVKTPTGFKDAWKKLYESGFKSLAISPEFGGQGAPRSVVALTGELTTGANTAFDMYPGLTMGAAELIEAFGTEEQRARYCPKMYDGTWAGTMCLTEPQAGSDVGSAASKAVKNADGTYTISGTKLFISGGDQDLTNNIIHMVLARTEGAPKGTKGLSLFIVPRNKVKPDGTAGENNDVKCIGIEHKMGINGSSTALLQFGDDGNCIGELCGTEEQRGIRQMFKMMNYARIGVGLQGLGIASAAYFAALDYARDRKQGTSTKNWKDPDAPRVPIIEHPNVRRMLLDMKGKVEGIRALIVKASWHLDQAAVLAGKDDDKALYHQGQTELLTPLVKSYSSDTSFRVAELAIQVHGGVGYTRDYPVEQHCRDAKIFSIYEGTNGIQALDLVARKLGQNGGANFRALLEDISVFVEKNKAHPLLGNSVKKLGAAQEAVGSGAMQFMAWFGGGEMDRIPLHANRFLNMMSETVVGWLLLDAAVIATEAQKSLKESDPDWAFYEGKKCAAMFFATDTLCGVPGMVTALSSDDRSALDIPEAAFG
ncbi:MAG TPA: acyl-CoA dehydrogenase [Polyangiaceae bacterium]|nr:acyl-CoA dehydrogenase [Polyangiaceae bacterium]